MLILIILLLLELYFPYVIYSGINISPDFLLIIIILLSFRLDRSRIIIISFFIGLIKDLLIQYSFFGFLSLIHTCFSYGLGNIHNIRDDRTKYFLISILIFFYFFITYQLDYPNSYILLISFSMLRTFITFSIFYLFKNIIKQ